MSRYYEKDEMMVARKIADELILVPIRNNIGDLAYMYTLNDVASRIWELLNGGTTLDDITGALTREYDIDASQLETDILEFLSQMKEIGAVVEREKGN